MPSSHGSILGFRTGFHPGKDSPESARSGINNRCGLLILFTQPQSNRQGVAQGDALLGGFQLVVLADGAEDGLVGAKLFEAGQHLLAQRVGQVARTIARVASKLRQGEDRIAGFAAGRVLPGEQEVDPPLDGLTADHGVGKSVQRDAGAEASQAPGQVTGRGWSGQLLDERPPQPLLDLGSQSLQAGGAAPHFRKLVRLRLGPAGLS